MLIVGHRAADPRLAGDVTSVSATPPDDRTTEQTTAGAPLAGPSASKARRPTSAQDQASELRAELDQARAERELARAERKQARVCARGSLGALSGIGKSDAEAAAALETVSSECAAVMGAENS